jgi:HSP20 family molecular chaperone IbpA
MKAPKQEGSAMARQSKSEIQRVEQSSAAPTAEQTRPGAVYSPAVDIFENDNSITLLADMPGLDAQDLKIDLRENVLTLAGRVTATRQPAESEVLSEYEPGMFLRQFTLSETIDQAKIDAELTDGVLRLELPKVERARPRQIIVRSD